ncbi:MAG: hypothetical protein U0169_12385 [Polyangiaceae bacterium]
MKTNRILLAGACVATLIAAASSMAACSDSKDDTDGGTTSDASTNKDTGTTTDGAVKTDGSTSDAGTTDGGGDAAASACTKYGGASAIDMIVTNDVVAKLAGDCRISKHFTSLPAAQLTHVKECLSIQVQEVFGCPGVTYTGAKDKAGGACRDMVAAHKNLGLTSSDFDALIEDVVAVLTAKGVSMADINAVAPTLTSATLKAAVIAPQALGTGADAGGCTSQPVCSADAGTADAATGKYASCNTACGTVGGPRVVDTVVQTNLVNTLAGDCRISRHFTELPAAQLTHVKQCLSTQVQELFDCRNGAYAGSKDSAGAACRTMAAAHAGSTISYADFDALIDDTVKTLTAAGVPGAIINAAAPALTSDQMRADVTKGLDAGCHAKAALNDAGQCFANDAGAPICPN